MQPNNVRILSDDEIIALYWDRNEDAIQQTDLKYRAYLTKVANNILRDLQDSEECLNDTYLSAWNTIPPERPYLLKAFLSAIIRNHAMMAYRRQKAQKRVLQSQAISLSDIEDVLMDCNDSNDARVLTLVIEDYLSGLNKEQRHIFLGRYYFGKHIDDIAKEMGVSRSKVNKQIALIKQSLKEKLVKEGVAL